MSSIRCSRTLCPAPSCCGGALSKDRLSLGRSPRLASLFGKSLSEARLALGRPAPCSCVCTLGVAAVWPPETSVGDRFHAAADFHARMLDILEPTELSDGGVSSLDVDFSALHSDCAVFCAKYSCCSMISSCKRAISSSLSVLVFRSGCCGIPWDLSIVNLQFCVSIVCVRLRTNPPGNCSMHT